MTLGVVLFYTFFIFQHLYFVWFFLTFFNFFLFICFLFIILVFLLILYTILSLVFYSFSFFLTVFLAFFYHSLSIHFIYIPINAIDIDILFYVNLYFQQFTVFLYNIPSDIKKIHLMVDLILKQKKILGNFLSSLSLLSALSGLTSVFGMGTGVPHSLSLPRKYGK